DYYCQVSDSSTVLF
nr:immunoglobulin light chain junction region [Macaca mulatta]MOW36311.1 immunoglobulin light chain junction region [Macaca mulatta]MOW36373.1 immunoglobulin light chain junction region [Macaca mulatta]MOW36703.1 immunoglobulin light chain junction region [Macaca mulatta]MOW37337.1 immunoglobulin light chain junction region [Macaca mulatta]